MSNLDNYINKVKSYVDKRGDMNEMDIIRYVYLDLGKRFSFNLKFAFGGINKRRKIYEKNKKLDKLNKSMETNTIICESSSLILEHILKEFGVDIKAVKVPNDYRVCAHMYNIVKPKDGEEYIIDLQQDLENIQAHACTKAFGLSTKEKSKEIIRRFELEQIDKKIGYISEDNYYSDDYIYLLKSDIGDFSKLQDKLKFVLENIEIYENPDMKYAERTWHHENILKSLFSKEEMRRIQRIDCYRKIGKKKEYENCICIDIERKTHIFIFRKKKIDIKKYQLKSLQNK